MCLSESGLNIGTKPFHCIRGEHKLLHEWSYLDMIKLDPKPSSSIWHLKENIEVYQYLACHKAKISKNGKGHVTLDRDVKKYIHSLTT